MCLFSINFFNLILIHSLFFPYLSTFFPCFNNNYWCSLHELWSETIKVHLNENKVSCSGSTLFIIDTIQVSKEFSLLFHSFFFRFFKWGEKKRDEKRSFPFSAFIDWGELVCDVDHESQREMEWESGREKEEAATEHHSSRENPPFPPLSFSRFTF